MIRDILAFDDNTEVELKVLLIRKDLKKSQRTQGVRLEMELGDSSGTIKGIVFDDAETVDSSISVGRIYSIKGVLGTFNKERRIVIAPSGLSEITGGDIYSYLPRSERDIEEMWREFLGLIRSVKDKYMSTLLKYVFIDDKEFAGKFKKAPAAVFYHQNYVGGLLEHTLKVVNICMVLAKEYENIQRDLLVTGALLHDIGKVLEYKVFPLERTFEGRLLGHIALGYNMVKTKIDNLRSLPGMGFPKVLELGILHMILSHHGRLEWGSPVVPMTPEALVLHYADVIDSKMWSVFDKLKEAERQGDVWTDAIKSLDNIRFFNPSSLKENAEEDF